jgi:hypothetical protein
VNAKILEQEDFQLILRALRFFCISADKIQMCTLKAIKMATPLFQPETIEQNKQDLNWQHAAQIWKNFGCMINSLLFVVKDRIQKIDQYFNNNEQNSPSSLRHLHKKNSATKPQEIESIYKRLQSIEIIICSRGRLWQEHHHAIQNALDIKQPNAKETIFYILERELYVNIKLLRDQMSKFENEINTYVEYISLCLPKEQINEINQEIVKNDICFLDDLEDEQDRKEFATFLADTFTELARTITQTDLREKVSLPSNTLEPINLLFHYFQNAQENNQALKESFITQTKINKQRENGFQSRLAHMDLLFKQSRFSHLGGLELKNSIQRAYKIVVSINASLNFCQSTLQTLLDQIDKFKKNFQDLKAIPHYQMSIETDWAFMQDRHEQQKIIKSLCTLSHPPVVTSPVSDSQTLIDLEQLKCAEIEEKKEIEAYDSPASSDLDLSNPSFFHQFFPLLRFDDRNLTNASSFSVVHKKIIRSIYQDVHFHWTLTGSIVDLAKSIQQKKSHNQFFPYLGRALIRSLSILTEQFLTAELLTQNFPYAILDHSHVKLAQLLEKKTNKPLAKNHFNFFKQLDKGVIFHRYPYPYVTKLSKHNERALNGLIHPQSLTYEKIKILIDQALQFLNDRQTLSPQALSTLQKNLAHAFSAKEESITIQQELPSCFRQIPQLIQDVNNLLQKVSISIENQRKSSVEQEQQDILQNLHYHLEGLKQTLDGLIHFPDIAYLLAHGDLILMHLQHIDELIEANMHLRRTNERLYMHNLITYRQLRGHQENIENHQIIADLNCGAGDHYPYRYEFLSHLPSQREKEFVFPRVIYWRLDALTIALHSDAFEQGFVPALSRKTRHFHHPEQLRTYLMKMIIHVLTMAKRMHPSTD